MFVINLSAQETVVVGQVLDKTDQSPIPSVNIYFKNSTIGTQSNEEGYFLIRTNENVNTLIFSAVGYKTEQIHVRPGQSVGLQMEMQEENTLLQEVFVIPGANPALELMKKVRILRKTNDITQQPGFSATGTEQNLVLLSKVNQHNINRRIFDQLKTAALPKADSSLVVPLYMIESKELFTPSGKKELSKNIFSSPEPGEKLAQQLVGSMETSLNFYENIVSVFGKNIISPLSSAGYAYYDYFLADSTGTGTNKQYMVHFRTKNAKNLAFVGKMTIDSTTLALTSIEAELPNQANINFIHNLRISEKFSRQPNNFWTRQSDELALNMRYEALADSLHPNPEIFIKRTTNYNYNDSITAVPQHFAQSEYSVQTLDEKLRDLNNTPMLRTAKWIAEVMFTGYMNVGKIDIGKVEQIMRIDSIEGLRLTLPFRTSEHLWKNVSLGGSVGYGFRDKDPKYSFGAQIKMPGNRHNILSMSYIYDYRRIDYNYNDFLFRENPLITGDEDISSSVFAFKSAGKISRRSEIMYSLSNDWTSGIESTLYLHQNTLFANAYLPMQSGTTSYNSLKQQSVTLSTRFSFGEKKYDDYMQRIYIANTKPVIYGTLEYGRYQFGNQSGNYGKLSALMRQFYKFDIGQFNYILDAGWIFGNVPYPMLEMPPGSETGGYSTFQFNMMNYGEYVADKYVNLHTELMFNGLIMNQIPLIKELNLREMCSFNMAYGGLDNSHLNQMDLPSYMYPLNKPYMEVGVGLTNILGIFTLQSVWRLTDLNHPGTIPWGLRGCLSLTF